MSNRTDFSLEDRAHTLSELAYIVAPRAFDLWLSSADLLATLPPEPDKSDLSYVLDWKPGGSIRLKAASRRREIEGRRAALYQRISTRILAAIASPRCLTLGIVPAGTMLELPRDLASQIVIDLKGNTLSTRDGGMMWRGVMVRPIGAKAADIPAARPGQKGWQRAKVRSYIDSHYPKGLPAGLTVENLVDELRGAEIHASGRTVSRAMGRR